jgi:hypothetical protein
MGPVPGDAIIRSDDGNRAPSHYASAYSDTFHANIEDRPLFAVDDPSRWEDFLPAATSPTIDAGVALTRTTAAGTGLEVPVQYAGHFTAGNGLIEGDLVRVGDNLPVRVMEVDASREVLVFESPITFSTNDPVGLPYQGAGPDIGLGDLDPVFETGCEPGVDCMDAPPAADGPIGDAPSADGGIPPSPADRPDAGPTVPGADPYFDPDDEKPPSLGEVGLSGGCSTSGKGGQRLPAVATCLLFGLALLRPRRVRGGGATEAARW